MLRVIPDMLSCCNDYFSFDHSTFNMEGYKAGSARQAMFNDFKIPNSFTLENSFFAKYSEKEADKQNEILLKSV